MTTKCQINTFARIRPSLCWEKQSSTAIRLRDTVGIAPEFVDKAVLRPLVNFHAFNRVFADDDTTHDVFYHSVKGLCDWVTNTTETTESSTARSALFIVYGQSTSGKTYTTIGEGEDGKDSVKGILYYAVDYLLHHHETVSLSLQVLESYASNKKTIHIFDVLTGEKVNDLKNVHSQPIGIKEIQNWTQIQKVITRHLHISSTARSPTSSRGHVLYTLDLKRNNGFVSKLAICDLAGSDGHSVISSLPTTNRALTKLRKTENRMISKALDGVILMLTQFRKGKKPKNLKRSKSQNLSDLASDDQSLQGIEMLLNDFLRFKKRSKFFKIKKRSSTTQSNKITKVNMLFCLSPHQFFGTRNTLRVAHQITECRISPERCTWSKEVIDKQVIKKRFLRILAKIQDDVRILQKKDKLGHKQLNSIANSVRNAIDVKHKLNDLEHRRAISTISKLPSSSVEQQNEMATNVEAQRQIMLDLAKSVLRAKESDTDMVKRWFFSLSEYQDNLNMALRATRESVKAAKEGKGTEEDKRRHILLGVVINKEKDALDQAVRACMVKLSQLHDIPVEKIRTSAYKHALFSEMEDTKKHIMNDEDSWMSGASQLSMNAMNDEDSSMEFDHLEIVDEDKLSTQRLELEKYQRVLTSVLDIIHLHCEDGKHKENKRVIAHELDIAAERISELSGRQMAIRKLKINVREALEFERCFNESVRGGDEETSFISSDVDVPVPHTPEKGLVDDNDTEQMIELKARDEETSFISTDVHVPIAPLVSTTDDLMDFMAKPFIERVPTDQALEQLTRLRSLESLPEEKLTADLANNRSSSSLRRRSSVDGVMSMTPGDLENMMSSSVTPFRSATGWTKMLGVSATGGVTYGELSSLVAHIEDGADIKVIFKCAHSGSVHSFVANEVCIGKNGVVWAQSIGSTLVKPDEAVDDLNLLGWGPKVVSSEGSVVCCSGKSSCNVTFFAKL